MFCLLSGFNNKINKSIYLMVERFSKKFFFTISALSWAKFMISHKAKTNSLDQNCAVHYIIQMFIFTLR